MSADNGAARLPSLVVIGAMKGGTSALAAYLDRHPAIHMAPGKELDFFVAERNWRRGVEWYASQFRPCGEAVLGEASPLYAMAPRFDGVPGRLAATLPGVRLVYCVREPVARIRSHHLHEVARGRTTRRLGDVDDATMQHYVEVSSYAMQLRRWFAHVEREQVLVVSSEQLRSDRRAAMRRVFAHVGVDPDAADLLPFDDEVHRTADKPARTRVGYLAARLPGHDALRRLTPGPLRSRVRAVTSGALDPRMGDLTPDERARLVERLEPDVARLRALLGDDAPTWASP